MDYQKERVTRVSITRGVELWTLNTRGREREQEAGTRRMLQARFSFAASSDTFVTLITLPGVTCHPACGCAGLCYVLGYVPLRIAIGGGGVWGVGLCAVSGLWRRRVAWRDSL